MNASRNILNIVKNKIMRKERSEYLKRTKSSIQWYYIGIELAIPMFKNT